MKKIGVSLLSLAMVTFVASSVQAQSQGDYDSSHFKTGYGTSHVGHGWNDDRYTALQSDETFEAQTPRAPRARYRSQAVADAPASAPSKPANPHLFEPGVTLY